MALLSDEGSPVPVMRALRRRFGDVRFAHALERLGLRVIWVDQAPYLLRIYLFHRWRHRFPGLYLHYFFRSDDARELHNHPGRRSRSLILSGGYIEHRLEPSGVIGLRTLRPGMVNRIDANDFHRVTLISAGCWTLFMAGERTQEWGFKDASTGVYESSTAHEARTVMGAP